MGGVVRSAIERAFLIALSVLVDQWLVDRNRDALTRRMKVEHASIALVAMLAKYQRLQTNLDALRPPGRELAIVIVARLSTLIVPPALRLVPNLRSNLAWQPRPIDRLASMTLRA